MSTKKFNEGYGQGVRIFLLLSLCLHIVIIGFLAFPGSSLNWLSARKSPYKRPVVVQVVELPPGYNAPQVKKRPETRIKRYADRTSVVEKETIPETRGVKIPGAVTPPQPRPAPPAPTTRKERPSIKGKKTALKAPAMTGPGKGTGARAEKIGTARTPEATEAPGDAVKKAEAEKTVEKETGGEVVVKGAVPQKKRPGPQGGGMGGIIGGGGGAEGAAGRPNLLLPEKKVAELERQYASAPQKGERTKTLQLNTSELKYQRYLVDLKNRIQLFWEYPGVAVRNGWEGKLNIDFTINKDGTIKALKLSRSSRYPVLDDSAVTALKLAAPFPAFPKDFDIEEIKIHGQFVYNIISIGPR